MNNPSFISLMFSQFLDTWIVSEESEVDALVDYLYEQLIGYELKNNSRKTKDTLKIVLLNLYSTYLSDPRLFLRYSRDETFYSNWIRRYVGTSLKYQSLVTKVIPALLRLKLIEDHKGFHDRREFGRGFQSRMRAKPKLIKLFDQFGLQPWMLSR